MQNANSPLAGFSFSVTRNTLTSECVLSLTSPDGSASYHLSYNSQAKLYALTAVLDPEKIIKFDVVDGRIGAAHFLQSEHTPPIARQEVMQIRTQVNLLFSELLLNSDQLLKSYEHKYASAPRQVKQKAAKPAAPTQKEIEQAERERELLEEEEKRRKQTSAASKDPVFKELKKMVDCVNQDINYLNSVIRNKQRPNPVRAQEIVQHLRSMHRMEKMAISPANKELLEQLIEKRKSLEFLLLKSLNKLNTASKAQDTEFNRFNTTYKIPRGSNIIGHPVGKLFDLPRAYKYKPEDFVRDTSNSISRNEVQKTVGLQFFDSSAPAKTSTPVDQFLRSLIPGNGC